jgi:hypothetical protein
MFSKFLESLSQEKAGDDFVLSIYLMSGNQ